MRAVIDWGLQKSAEKLPPAALQLSPSIRTKHVAVTSWLHDVPSETVNASNLESSMTQLSHLEFLPPSGEASGRMTPPTIMTVRCHLPISTAHYNQSVHSTIDRWEVREKPQTVHPAFEQLTSRRNSVGSQPGVREAQIDVRIHAYYSSLSSILRNLRALPSIRLCWLCNL